MPIKPARLTIPQLIEKLQQFPAGAVVTRIVAEGGEPTWEGSIVRRCTYTIEVEIPAAAAKPTKEGEPTANRELIERLAREADLVGDRFPDGTIGAEIPEFDPFKLPPSLEVFATLIAEECAKVAETVPVEFFASIPGERQAQAHRAATAAAIRSKFSKG